jgi:hypothetical protein
MFAGDSETKQRGGDVVSEKLDNTLQDTHCVFQILRAIFPVTRPTWWKRPAAWRGGCFCASPKSSVQIPVATAPPPSVMPSTERSI